MNAFLNLYVPNSKASKYRENIDKTTRKMDKSCSILAPYFGYS